MWLDENDYPVKPDEIVVPIHLKMYFSDWSAKFQERQVQNKLAKDKRDESRQAKDSAPNAQSNVMAPPLTPAKEGHDFFLEYELLGLTRHHARALAAAYLFCCYAVMRVEQAQECWVGTIRNNEFIEGYVCLDQNPVRSKMQPRPFWAPLYGITNSKLYFTTLLDSLKDVTDKCFIFALTRVQTAL